jgi:hypothetical protein
LFDIGLRDFGVARRIACCVVQLPGRALRLGAVIACKLANSSEAIRVHRPLYAMASNENKLSDRRLGASVASTESVLVILKCERAGSGGSLQRLVRHAVTTIMAPSVYVIAA